MGGGSGGQNRELKAEKSSRGLDERMLSNESVFFLGDQIYTGRNIAGMYSSCVSKRSMTMSFVTSGVIYFPGMGPNSVYSGGEMCPGRVIVSNSNRCS